MVKKEGATKGRVMNVDRLALYARRNLRLFPETPNIDVEEEDSESGPVTPASLAIETQLGEEPENLDQFESAHYRHESQVDDTDQAAASDSPFLALTQTSRRGLRHERHVSLDDDVRVEMVRSWRLTTSLLLRSKKG